MFSGSIVALITTFRNREIDEKAFQDFVAWQIDSGTHGLVPCGTTGESPTLSHAEHHRLIDLCVETAARRVPVIAGTGSNSTEEAISLTRHAKKQGADAALIVAPYYNKPTQEGLYQHYKAIQDSVDIPIIVYNIPGRSVVDISLETMVRLAKLPNIVGVKDASPNLTRPTLMREMIGPDFCLLSGEDGTAAGYLGQGGHGCISVTANVAPRACAQMHEAWQAGDLKTFAQLRDRLSHLHEALFIETSPAPVKYAVSKLGLSTDEVRLPLMPATPQARAAVDKAMAHAGLSKEDDAAWQQRKKSQTGS